MGKKLKSVKNLKDTLDPDYAPLMGLTVFDKGVKQEQTIITISCPHRIDIFRDGKIVEIVGDTKITRKRISKTS